MTLRRLFNRARDYAYAANGPSLLISGFTTLFWYFPRSDKVRVAHRGSGRYYGLGLSDSANRLLVMSRPDQERDDVLLELDHWTGCVSRRWQLDSRDTHQVIRDGSRLLVTDSFRGRLLVYRVPDITLLRSYDNFDCQAHINSVRLIDGDLYLLAHNFGASTLYRLDQASGSILDTWPDFGQSSHDIVPFQDAFLTLDSFGGGLLRVHRATKQARTLWAERDKFTKGLCVEDGIAYFGVSPPTQREERYVVACEVAAFDLARERVLWRRPTPFHGLINAMTTPRQLAREKKGT